MGRRPRGRSLAIWMNKERVGTWGVDAQGRHELRYGQEWLDSPSSRPLSLSMPLRPPDEPYRGLPVRDYFDNLLPDTEELRQRVQSRFGARSTDAFDLLTEVGRDCVGALVVLPETEPPPDPTEVRGEPLTEEQVARHLREVADGRSWGHDDSDFRISLAGAHEKTALLWQEGRWMKPLGATPTTHIFKLPLGRVGTLDLSRSVENEWLCHQLFAAFGIPVAACSMSSFAGQTVLVVDRFDRRRQAMGNGILRLPQEDLCQATATPRALKYEADGGPGIRRILDLLLGGERALEDREDFYRTQVAFWLLCAIDGHAKNFSIFLLPGGRFRLTPRYDVLSAYPLVRLAPGGLSEHEVKLAMAVWGRNRHYDWIRITRRHWLQVGRDCGIARAEDIVDGLIESCPDVLDQVSRAIPDDFPPDVSGPILEGVAVAARRLRSR